MKKRCIALLFGIACLQSQAFAGDEEGLLVLDIEIRADDERVSTPRVAFAANGDASVRQELDDGAALAIGFHSTHLDDDGAEMLVDIDFGIGNPGHVESRLVTLRWGEPYEVIFFAAKDTPAMRLRVTPSRAKRSDIPLRPEG